jgi:FkbM family methyltransferase
MNTLWCTLNYLPSGVMSAVKACTPARLRRLLREQFRGTHRAIPERVVSAPDGRRFRIGPDPIYWSIYTGASFEPEATAVAAQLICPGDTVVDAGANFGWYTTLFARLVGESGHVHAFEPVPSTYQRLLDNIQLNGCGNRVSAIPMALSTLQGEAVVYHFKNLSHSRSSLSTLDQTEFHGHPTRLIDLDTYLARGNVSRADFLKCDVEGSELLVMSGCRRLLSSADAPMILVELNKDTSAAFGYTPSDLWTFLRESGYDRFYRIDAADRISRIGRPAEVGLVNLLLCGKGGRIESRFAAPR